MASRFPGYTREARWLICGLVPGGSCIVPWAEGRSRRDWQARVAGTACSIWGAGECRTTMTEAGVRVERVARDDRAA